MKRLLILACSATKSREIGRVSGRDRYMGPLWTTLRARDPAGSLAKVAFLSAKLGFRDAVSVVDPYDMKMTPDLAKLMISGGLGTRWPCPSSSRCPDTSRIHAGVEIASMTDDGCSPFDDVAIVGGHLYIGVMSEFVRLFREGGFVTPNAELTVINGPIGYMRRDLKDWLLKGQELVPALTY